MVIEHSQLHDLRTAHEGSSIVLTTGCFDLLHVGHLEHLAAAGAMSDILVVSVLSDAKLSELKPRSRSIIDQHSRAVMVAGLKSVNYAIVEQYYSGTDRRGLFEILEALRPDVFTVNDDTWLAYERPMKRMGVDVRPLHQPKRDSTTAIIERARQLELTD